MLQNKKIVTAISANVDAGKLNHTYILGVL
jgi:hypothetical protein